MTTSGNDDSVLVFSGSLVSYVWVYFSLSHIPSWDFHEALGVGIIKYRITRRQTVTILGIFRANFQVQIPQTIPQEQHNLDLRLPYLTLEPPLHR